MNTITHNNKYVTALTIASKIASRHKKKKIDILDIVEWCAEVECEILGDFESFVQYNRYKLKVINQQALLPCNCYRLLDVISSSNRRVNNYNNGTYLNFIQEQTFDFDSELSSDVVFINFIGIAIDEETGYPLIKKGHELACEAYCIYNLYYEDFLNNKIDVNRWQFIDNAKQHQLEAARNGFKNWTGHDLQRVFGYISNNMIPRLDKMPLAHLNGIEF